jgi:hypothetical protein
MIFLLRPARAFSAAAAERKRGRGSACGRTAPRDIFYEIDRKTTVRRAAAQIITAAGK